MTYEYDEAGRLTKQHIHTEASDSAGTVSTADAGNAYTANAMNTSVKTTEYSYDSDNNLIRTRDWLGNITRNEYDNFGRIIRQYDALKNLICENTYDANGRITAVKDALGNTTTYTYDADGNLSTETDPTGAVTKNTYDEHGNLTSVTNPLGKTTTYEYDERSRLIKVTTPEGTTAAYTYDNAGNLIMQLDGSGKGILYTYNVAGLKTSRQDIQLDINAQGSNEETNNGIPYDAITQYGEKETYTYTPDGKLSTKIDRNGVVTEYTYDGFGRLTSESAGGDIKVYEYDDAGNLISMTDNKISAEGEAGGISETAENKATGNTTTMTYDAEGRVSCNTVDGIGTATYIYDINAGDGKLKEITENSDGYTVERTYDKAGRLITVTAQNEGTVTYTYNANGSRQSAIYADGTKEEYTYDAASRVTKLTHTDRDGKLLDSYEYVYDADGNLLSEKSAVGTTLYTYDGDGRIKTVIEPDGKLTSYTYDQSGNRSTKTVTIPSTENRESAESRETTAYVYNLSNHLIKEITTTQVTEYEYDANGNLLNKKTYATDTSAETDESDLETDAENSTESGSSDSDTEETDDISEPTEITRYTYDNFNRLTIFSNSGEFAEYEYDAADYRIRKRVVSGEEDVTGYFYEGGNVSFEADQKGNITNHNVYGTNLLLRSDTETEKSHYYLYNAHGDVVRLTQTDTGDTAAEYRYDAFGNITYSTGDADNAITYAGYQYDAESGLYYVNARYYDSSTGRFITEDTYEGKYTDPLSLNRYTYCHNNPTRYTDPTGHAILPLIVGFGKFALGATFGAGMELFNQVFIEKRDKIGWGEVAFEGFAGGVGALAGAGSADDVIRATTKIGKAKAAVKTVTKAGCVDGAIGFTADVGKQALVEGKSLDEIDYGQAAKSGAISGVAGMGGAAFDMVADGTTALAKGVTRNADNAAESAGDAVRKGQHPKAKQNSPDADAPAHIKGMDEDVDTTGMGDRDVDTTGMGDQDVDTTGMGDAPAGTILSSPEPQKEIRETVEVAEEIHPDPAEEAAARAQAEAELNARRQAAMQSAQSKTIQGSCLPASRDRIPAISAYSLPSSF